MIVYKTGDIFDSEMQTLVNPVNTSGAMGKGLAVRFRNMYRDMYNSYKLACILGEIRIGQMWYWTSGDYKVCNFPTKEFWGDPSRIEWIDLGLQGFVQTYKENEITGVAFPKIGCGEGGLDFETEVNPLMVKYLNRLDIPVEIYV